MGGDFRSIDDYIAAQPDAARTALNQVRNAIRKVLPRAEEGISYKIPVYRLNGKRIIFFAGWKQHYSLYLAGDRLVAAFKQELEPYEISRGTIRFPLSEPVPIKLIQAIAKFRATESSQRSETKPPASRRTRRTTSKKTGANKPAKRKERIR
ncbi:MAG: iron chaperone [Candidatus Acidiferrales bacterium]